MSCKIIKSGLAFAWKASRSFSSKPSSNGQQLKCLSEAIKIGDFTAIEKIIIEQDPYEVRRVEMPTFTTLEEPNIIASTSNSRLIGCLCEPEADAINWMEITKGKPVKCYCGHWFKLVDFEEYLSASYKSKKYTTVSLNQGFNSCTNLD